MISKASVEGIRKEPEVELNEVSKFEEKKVGPLDLLDMKMETGPPSKERKRIRKLSTLLIGNKLIGLDDLVISGKNK